MAQQQPPPPTNFSTNQNFGYMQQPPAPLAAQHYDIQQKPGLVNGFPQNVSLPTMKPMQIPSQQLPPQQQSINYQNFQTKAVQPASGLNGSNSALSSRTSSPGVQNAPQSQLPPSKSYPSYQHLHGAYQQQPPMATTHVAPSSQLVTAPIVNNNNIGDGITATVPPMKTNFNTNPINASTPNLQASPVGMPPMAYPQMTMSASMRNLSLNQTPGILQPPSMLPSSKSDQNLLNNNNLPGMPPVSVNGPQMPQQIQAPKPNTMAKRPMYPQQTPVQQLPSPMNPNASQLPQPQAFSSFPAAPNQTMQSPQQPKANLQYQNFPQQPQQPQQQQPGPGSVVHQGFNRMWGNETIDLMQNRHVLPQTKVLPPPVKLNHQFHEAVNCSADIFRCTLTKIPESNSLLQKSRLPLGILIHPYRDLSVSVRIISRPDETFSRIYLCYFRICRSSAVPRL